MKRQKRQFTMGIYKITNTKNGKIYIGQGKNVYARIHRHLNGNGSVVIRDALKGKYKRSDFVWEVLIFCEQDMLDYYETKFIEYYDCVTPKGMNIELGGCENKLMGKEAKERLKTQMLGKRHTDDTVDLCIIKGLTTKNSTATKVKDNQGRVWASIGDCSFELNIKHLNVYLQGRRKPPQEVIDLDICYADENDTITQFPYEGLSIEEIKERRNKKFVEKGAKPIISKDGKMWIGANSCSRDLFNLQASNTLVSFLLGQPVSEYYKEMYSHHNLRFMTKEEIEENTEELLSQRNKSTKMVRDNKGNIYKSIKECSEKLDIPHLGLYFSGTYPWPDNYKAHGLEIISKEEQKLLKPKLEKVERTKYIDKQTGKIYKTWKEVKNEFNLPHGLQERFRTNIWIEKYYWVRDRFCYLEDYKEQTIKPTKSSKIDLLF